ncbi:MAG: response regulator transcription factor [Kiritimatiellia bacterium]
MARIRVLIVDDHPIVRDGLKAMLSFRPGFTVAGTAENGEAAIAFVRQNGAPDVVLMDVRMPGMDGFETLEKMQRFYPNIRALLLAGLPLHAEEERARAARAGGYLAKSAAQTVICDALRRIASDPTAFLTEEWQPAFESPITARELEVLQALADGCSREDAADKLGISHETVKAHARSILVKMDARNMSNAIAKGFQLGLLHG